MKKTAKKRVSAGLLMYRTANNLEVLLAHPGGPFFTKKDSGHWSIPKGEPDENEDLLLAAKREFEEETGIKPIGNFTELGSIIQKGGKEVFCWAFECDLPENFIHKCNTFEMEWPPKSGKLSSFMEIDRVEFFSVKQAKVKIREAQQPFIERLVEKITAL